MPSEPNNPPVEIRFTPEFKRNIRALSKRYHRIRSDIEPILNQLQAGIFVGDQIPHTGYTLYKVRVRNRDAQRGKSGGYRLIIPPPDTTERHSHHALLENRAVGHIRN